MKAPATHRFSYPTPASSRRSFLTLSAGGALLLATGVRLGAVAAAQETGYDQGKKMEGDYTFTGGTYTSYEGDTLYQYARDDKLYPDSTAKGRRVPGHFRLSEESKKPDQHHAADRTADSSDSESE